MNSGLIREDEPRFDLCQVCLNDLVSHFVDGTWELTDIFVMVFLFLLGVHFCKVLPNRVLTLKTPSRVGTNRNFFLVS